MLKKHNSIKLLAMIALVSMIVSACTTTKSTVSFDQFVSTFQTAEPSSIKLDFPQVSTANDTSEFHYGEHSIFYLDFDKSVAEELQQPWDNGVFTEQEITEGKQIFQAYHEDLYELITQALSAIVVTEVKSPQEISTYWYEILIDDENQQYRMVIDRNRFVSIDDLAVAEADRVTKLYELNAADYRKVTDAFRDATLVFYENYGLFYDQYLARLYPDGQ